MNLQMKRVDFENGTITSNILESIAPDAGCPDFKFTL